jgi:hypothetical protein
MLNTITHTRVHTFRNEIRNCWPISLCKRTLVVLPVTADILRQKCCFLTDCLSKTQHYLIIEGSMSAYTVHTRRAQYISLTFSLCKSRNNLHLGLSLGTLLSCRLFFGDCLRNNFLIVSNMFMNTVKKNFQPSNTNFRYLIELPQ